MWGRRTGRKLCLGKHHTHPYCHRCAEKGYMFIDCDVKDQSHATALEKEDANHKTFVTASLSDTGRDEIARLLARHCGQLEGERAYK